MATRGRIYTTTGLIATYGQYDGNSKCAMCGLKTLYAIRYSWLTRPLMLCSNCDAQPEARAA